MSNLRETGWTQVSAILSDLAQMSRAGGSPTVPTPAVGVQVPSSSASAASTPKGSASRDAREREYVRVVLDFYRRLPGTSSVTSRHDRHCVEELFRRAVPLDVVKGAMLVAVARRTFRPGGPLPRVRAVAYFLSVIEELLESPCAPGYLEYLERKLEPLAAAKAASRSGEASSPTS
jgi:hypothetical protein